MEAPGLCALPATPVAIFSSSSSTNSISYRSSPGGRIHNETTVHSSCPSTSTFYSTTSALSTYTPLEATIYASAKSPFAFPELCVYRPKATPRSPLSPLAASTIAASASSAAAVAAASIAASTASKPPAFETRKQTPLHRRLQNIRSSRRGL